MLPCLLEACLEFHLIQCISSIDNPYGTTTYQGALPSCCPHHLFFLQVFIVVWNCHAFGIYHFGHGLKGICHLYLQGIRFGRMSEVKDGLERHVAKDGWELLRVEQVEMEEVEMRRVDSNMMCFLSEHMHCSPFQGQLITESYDWLGTVRIKDPLGCRSQRLPTFVELFSFDF